MRRTRTLLLAGLAVATVAGIAVAKHRSATTEENDPMAPELTGAVAWINTDHPITMAELRGRVVILDFWTYGCINCMHVLPVLRHLEEAHVGEPLEVIGVHSAKFENEKAPDRVRAAVERYGITHPVAVDSEMAIWEHYGVRAWPTLVVIRPDGRVAGSIPGEASFDQLDKVVRGLMDEARSRGKLASGPALPHQAQKLDTGELAYPGKVIAAPDGRLFIADSRHHRVLLTSPDGRILDQIGKGTQGRKDGTFETAELDDPQGMAMSGNTLYLADARGYAVLRLDLAARTVSTLAGTGRLGNAPLEGPTKAAALDIRSPWDVALQGDKLYVAMAGSHQIGVLDLTAGTLARFAGNGNEAIHDGDAEGASFAQPSGLSFSANGATLYVADSESSGVRAIDMKTVRTRTLLGTGLFDWGDGEGPLGPKLIQHPLAVGDSHDGLWIADSYNGKVKQIDRTGQLKTRVSAVAGKRLSDPGGVWVEPDGALLIADTGNDRILRLLPGAAEPSVIVVSKRDASSQTAVATTVAPGPFPANDKGAAIELGPHELPPGPQAIHFELTAPKGFAFSAGAPWSVALSSAGSLSIVSPTVEGEAQAGERIGFEAKGTLGSGAGSLTASVHANICDAVNHAACYPVRAEYALTVTPRSDARESARQPIALALQAPAISK